MVEQLTQINWIELIVNGIILGGLVGIIILFFEYRTGIFISKKQPYFIQQTFVYRLYGIQDKHKQDLEVLYKGRSVTRWGNVILEFGNDGRKPILHEDFEKGESIRFIFPENAVILAEPEITTYPNNLKCDINKLNDNIIEVRPLLLNHKEYFILNIFMENPQKAKIDARFVGVSEVAVKRRSRDKSVALAVTVFITLVAISFGIVLALDISPFFTLAGLVFSLIAFFFVLGRSYPDMDRPHE